MAIVINDKNIQSINTLTSLCPETFPYVPLRIYKDDDGQCYATIQTSDINQSVVFSGKVKFENDISALKPGDEAIIRLPLSKQITGILFNSAFDTLEINKTKIVAKGSNKRITISLYDTPGETPKSKIPYVNTELLEMSLSKRGISKIPMTQMMLNPDKIKEMMECMSILMNPENIIFSSTGEDIVITCEDVARNSIEYKMNEPSNEIFSSKFVIAADKIPMSIVKVMQKLSRYKDFNVDMLLCELMAAFTISNDNVVATIGIPAAQ